MKLRQGFIAQEVDEVCKKLNVEFGGYQDLKLSNNLDIKAINYTEFIAPIVSSIQTLSKKYDSLYENYCNLENRHQDLENRHQDLINLLKNKGYI